MLPMLSKAASSRQITTSRNFSNEVYENGTVIGWTSVQSAHSAPARNTTDHRSLTNNSQMHLCSTLDFDVLLTRQKYAGSRAAACEQDAGNRRGARHRARCGKPMRIRFIRVAASGKLHRFLRIGIRIRCRPDHLPKLWLERPFASHRKRHPSVRCHCGYPGLLWLGNSSGRRWPTDSYPNSFDGGARRESTCKSRCFARS